MPFRVDVVFSGKIEIPGAKEFVDWLVGKDQAKLDAAVAQLKEVRRDLSDSESHLKPAVEGAQHPTVS